MNAELQRRRTLRRTTDQLLADMLAYATETASFVIDIDEGGFREDELRRYAIERGLEIVGKAASLVLRAYRDAHPEIPWHELVKRWRALILNSRDVDDKDTWLAATVGLSALIEALDPLVRPPGLKA